MATKRPTSTAGRTKLNQFKSTAVSRLSWARANATNLYIESRVLKPGEIIRAYKQEIRTERKTTMVFADEAPEFNWAHPCRYLLYDADSGELYKDVKAEFPPYMDKVPSTFELFHEPVRIPKVELIWPVIPRLRCPIRWRRGERYAVLFSGGSNNRHTNDLEFLYRTLRDIYNFPAGNIYVLNYDGNIDYSGSPHPVNNWPGDNTAYRMPVHGEGTKSELDAVFDTLKGRLKSDDLLLIHTNNHGAHNGTESYLCTHSGADYLASDFAAKLSTLPKFQHLMVMMEQCNSGGFNAPILAQSPATHTSVSSACEELRSSIGGAEFDPFARDWIAAMAGATPYGGALASNPDTNGSGRVSAHEAHNYADSIHHSYDTPVYDESSITAGSAHLGQRYSFLWPWYCRLWIELLEPYYIRKPIPEFYRAVHDKIVPRLQDLEDELEKGTLQQEAEVRKVLSAALKRVM
jgi:hypothetical protein